MPKLEFFEAANAVDEYGYSPETLIALQMVDGLVKVAKDKGFDCEPYREKWMLAMILNIPRTMQIICSYIDAMPRSIRRSLKRGGGMRVDGTLLVDNSAMWGLQYEQDIALVSGVPLKWSVTLADPATPKPDGIPITLSDPSGPRHTFTIPRNR